MTKVELVKLVQEGLELKTKKEAEARIAQVDEIIELVAEAGYGKTKLGEYLTLEKVHEEEKSGKCAGKEWTKAAHDEVRIKRTSKLKNV